PRGMRLGSRITAAATTGPASGPRPASSQPATGTMPRLIAARSRAKVGRTGGSPKGNRGSADEAAHSRPRAPRPTGERLELRLIAEGSTPATFAGPSFIDLSPTHQ